MLLLPPICRCCSDGDADAAAVVLSPVEEAGEDPPEALIMATQPLCTVGSTVKGSCRVMSCITIRAICRGQKQGWHQRCGTLNTCSGMRAEEFFKVQG